MFFVLNLGPYISNAHDFKMAILRFYIENSQYKFSLRVDKEDISKCIKQNQSRDESESAKEEFDRKWAPYKDFTNRQNWHVCNSQGVKFSISSPMFEEENKITCCLINNEEKKVKSQNIRPKSDSNLP